LRASLWQFEDNWVSNAKLNIPVVNTGLKVVVIKERTRDWSTSMFRHNNVRSLVTLVKTIEDNRVTQSQSESEFLLVVLMNAELREWLVVDLDCAAVSLAVIHVELQLVILAITEQESGSVVELILGAESSEEINSERFSLGVKGDGFHESNVLWSIVTSSKTFPGFWQAAMLGENGRNKHGEQF
jgi:Na+/H+ antiporter NhaB